MRIRTSFRGATGLLLLAALAAPVQAGAIIDNKVVQLGVGDLGQLNECCGTPSAQTGTTIVGIRFMEANWDATSPGCACEGWGASYDNSVTGYVDNALTGPGGAGSITLDSFTSGSNWATSQVHIGDLLVRHEYRPLADVPNLYLVFVTIKNDSGADMEHVKYRRLMDWDVEPTAFFEYTTIAFRPHWTNCVTGDSGGEDKKGLDVLGIPVPGTATFVEKSPMRAFLMNTTTNGFDTPNPLSTINLGGGRFVQGPPRKCEIIDKAPDDQGALFDFDFGKLKRNDKITFREYYGAAGTEADADAALEIVDAEIYTYGHCGRPDQACDAATGEPITQIWAFGGLTRTQPPPPPTPKEHTEPKPKHAAPPADTAPRAALSEPEPHDDERPIDGFAAGTGDQDGDGVRDAMDDCVSTANADQVDLDADGAGDACDDDIDGDGIPDAFDTCPRDYDLTARDTDGDNIGDVCDEDMDGDGLLNALDNCIAIPNADQEDLDGDGLGDACVGVGLMAPIGAPKATAQRVQTKGVYAPAAEAEADSGKAPRTNLWLPVLAAAVLMIAIAFVARRSKT